MLSLRYAAYHAAIILSVIFFVLMLAVSAHFVWPFLIALFLALLGTWDLIQKHHSVLRNYPILAHMRFLFEGIRPELRQYFFESNLSGTPFSREQRTLLYERAKNEEAVMPFGTELDVYTEEHRWVNHSISPRPVNKEPMRVTVGGPDCTKPYSASLYNISAMSFGSLSPNAIRALNKGAKLGGFAHDTGEGGISRYHREHGGDLIWEIGSGYFGCRQKDGTFDPEMFGEKARDDQVKMAEIKISQGAKPGHGGILPAAKVTEEIAETRDVPMGQDCVSPSAHTAFSTPVELLLFVAKLRELSGGKPSGFKLCIGHRWEFMAICKAMIETGIKPDFIVIDGAEGGTGAAPVEFSDHIGTPLLLGLSFVQNVLVGTNLRDDIKIGASGKLVSAFDIAAAMCLGADWCNSARGFMFAVGCIQSQSCHTNTCPVGVATQDEFRQRALVVPDKAQRVYNLHRNTMHALTELVAASGLDHPTDFKPVDFYLREGARAVMSASRAIKWLEPGELFGTHDLPGYSPYWAVARADSFRPAA